MKKQAEQKKLKVEISKNPVYFDIRLKRYYYPEVALNERDVDRPIVKGKIPLEFNTNDSSYYHPDTKLKYLEFKSQEEFEQKKKERLVGK